MQSADIPKSAAEIGSFIGALNTTTILSPFEAVGLDEPLTIIAVISVGAVRLPIPSRFPAITALNSFTRLPSEFLSAVTSSFALYVSFAPFVNSESFNVIVYTVLSEFHEPDEFPKLPLSTVRYCIMSAPFVGSLNISFIESAAPSFTDKSLDTATAAGVSSTTLTSALYAASISSASLSITDCFVTLSFLSTAFAALTAFLNSLYDASVNLSPKILSAQAILLSSFE